MSDRPRRGDRGYGDLPYRPSRRVHFTEDTHTYDGDSNMHNMRFHRGDRPDRPHTSYRPGPYSSEALGYSFDNGSSYRRRDRRANERRARVEAEAENRVDYERAQEAIRGFRVRGREAYGIDLDSTQGSSYSPPRSYGTTLHYGTHGYGEFGRVRRHDLSGLPIPMRPHRRDQAGMWANERMRDESPYSSLPTGSDGSGRRTGNPPRRPAFGHGNFRCDICDALCYSHDDYLMHVHIYHSL